MFFMLCKLLYIVDNRIVLSLIKLIGIYGYDFDCLVREEGVVNLQPYPLDCLGSFWFLGRYSLILNLTLGPPKCLVGPLNCAAFLSLNSGHVTHWKL